MEVTTSRVFHVEMTGDEAMDLAASLRSYTAALLKLPEETRKFLADNGHHDRVLKFATALIHAPR